MAAAMRSTPEIEHHVLWPATNGAGPEGIASVNELPNGHLSSVQAVRRVAEATRPDIVHAHSSWAGLYARTALRTPVVYQPHAFAFSAPTMSAPVRWTAFAVERALSLRTAAFAVLSRDEGALATRLSRRTPQVRVPNVPTIPVAPRRSDAVSEHPTVVMIGRVGPQKNPAFFAEVALLADRVGFPASFVWIGDGETAAIAELERAQVQVTGWLDSDGLRTRLQGCDIYLHSADYEGFPLSILDALAAGVPVVARRIPALEETGLRMIDSPEAALQALRDFAQNPEALEGARTVGQRVLEDMNVANQAVALRSLYARAVPRCTS